MEVRLVQPVLLGHHIPKDLEILYASPVIVVMFTPRILIAFSFEVLKKL
jgi:hypothetical protein